MTEEKKITPEEYLLHCPKCSIGTNDNKKFIVNGVSRRAGVVLKCDECSYLISRRANKIEKMRNKIKEYNEEQINFLRQEFTYTSITREELTKKFNEKFKENCGKSTLGFVLTKYKILKNIKYHKRFPIFYDEEKLNFLRQHYEQTDTTREELVQLFNKKFKLDKSNAAIRHILKNYKILKDEKYHKAIAEKYSKEAQSLYTEEHTNFIRKNYTENLYMTRKENVKLFNERFGTNISVHTLGYIINRYGLRRFRTGRALIYNDEVKQFIVKCVKEGMTKQECKEACELQFERYFNKLSIGVVANKMGIIFRLGPKTEVDKFFEEHTGIEELIKKVISKYPDDNYQSILIRDAIIEKYQKVIKTIDIRIFCETKNIKINHLGTTLEQRREKLRKINKDRRRKEIKSEKLNDEYEEYV